jgi:Na+-transporting NADH:ubiquinone oxidoreductase subunit NqrE
MFEFMLFGLGFALGWVVAIEFMGGHHEKV